MHIITGLLITALLGKKAKDGQAQQLKSPLLRLKWPIETKHVLPGRVRFQIPLLRSDSSQAQRIERQLGKVEGISSVQANPVSGSVVLCYQRDSITPELLFAALIRLLDLEKELERTPQPLLAKELGNVGRALNQAVFTSTDGIIDLWTAVPLVLLGLGARKIITEKTLSFPGGFTLLWWAYSSFSRGKR